MANDPRSDTNACRNLESLLAVPQRLIILCVQYYKNKISTITMGDVSKGGGGSGGGSPEKRPYDVSHGQNRYVRLP